MKTIVYIGGFELPDKNAAAQRVVSNAKLFRDIGYEVLFIDTCREQNSEVEEREKCFSFERWSIKKSNRQLYSISKIIDIIETKSDVFAVIAYNYPSVALNKLRKYCSKKHIKIIADVTEWYGAQGNTLLHRVIKGLDSFYRMNIIQPKLDGIIVISRYLENFYKKKTNTVLLPPLTDLTEDKWNQCTHELEQNRLSILYAGSPGRHKDKLNLIVRALNQCENTNYLFKIIGITKEEYLSSYPKDTEIISNLEKNIIFMGRKPHFEVIKELKSTDFSLFYREVTRVTMAGFPTKFAESISAGTPVLTNKTSDLVDYLIEGVNGFWIEDIENDLKRVLSMDVSSIKNMKSKISTTTFYYRAYEKTIVRWIGSML